MLARLDVAGFVVPDRLGRFARRALPFSLCGKNETDVFSNIRPLFPQTRPCEKSVYGVGRPTSFKRNFERDRKGREISIFKLLEVIVDLKFV